MAKKRKTTKAATQAKWSIAVSIFVLVLSLVWSVYYIFSSVNNGNNIPSADINTNIVDESLEDQQAIVEIAENEELKNHGGSIFDQAFQQSATYLGKHCSGVCHMVPKNKDDILVKYNGEILVSGEATSDGHHFTDSFSRNLKIPAGNYRVKLEAFDSYTGRAGTDASKQKEEQYYVIFKKDGDVLAKTGKTKDLEDGKEEAGTIDTVSNPLILSKDADQIIVKHAGSGKNGALNGFEPVCMLLEATAVCGDGHKDKNEQCDDGNTKDGDGCSSECKKEEKPKPPKKKKEEKEEKEEEDCNASIGNYIWYDTNGNGKQDSIEEGISQVKVCAYRGNKQYCDKTDKHGKYKIDDLCPGKYTVRVKDVGGMVQTYDPDGKKDSKTKVNLDEGEKHTKADFGYRGAAPKTGFATNIILLLVVSILLTSGALFVMKRKGHLD